MCSVRVRAAVLQRVTAAAAKRGPFSGRKKGPTSVNPNCSAVCMRNSVSVSLGICRTAASLSLSRSLVCYLRVSVSAFVFLWHDGGVTG